MTCLEQHGLQVSLTLACLVGDLTVILFTQMECLPAEDIYLLPIPIWLSPLAFPFQLRLPLFPISASFSLVFFFSQVDWVWTIDLIA